MMIATTSLLILINSIREIPLVSSPYLTKISEQRCAEMQEWSHKGWWDKTQYKITNKYFYAGENLASNFPDATSTFYALQNSPTHRQNNQSLSYQKVGIANCNNIIGNITVIEFAGNK